MELEEIKELRVCYVCGVVFMPNPPYVKLGKKQPKCQRCGGYEYNDEE